MVQNALSGSKCRKGQETSTCGGGGGGGGASGAPRKGGGSASAVLGQCLSQSETRNQYITLTAKFKKGVHLGHRIIKWNF